jgi:hypothetical protein
MASLRVWISFGSIAWILLLFGTAVCQAQAPGSPGASAVPDPGPVATNTALAGPWEFTFDGRVGAPTGRLQVGEAFAPGGGAPGTLLRLRSLGIDVSGAVEGSVAFHATPNDAVRASYLYYFLRGSTTLTGPSVVYNGEEFTKGSLDTKADFYRISLAYERTLYRRTSGEQLIGSLGLTYVYFNPTLTGNTPPQAASSAETHGKSNSEDFYQQELPVPILGLRWDQPLGPQWLLRATVSGGGLPRVDSLRQEGGTVYLQQSHADAEIGLAYIVGPHTQLDVGYHFTYFFQHEKSHEDNNLFELIDNSAQVRFTVRF